VDPRASQKTAVSRVNIHYLKGNLTGMGAYLYREVDLSPNLSAGAAEGIDHHGTWL